MSTPFLIIATGHPASGKTTLARRLDYQALLAEIQSEIMATANNE